MVGQRVQSERKCGTALIIETSQRNDWVDAQGVDALEDAFCLLITRYKENVTSYL